eukprot:TRINITY_DN7268_c0_g1_i1.p2 TRINITY_DN7268_c0_g1~~TRINITY_DN7268_c0_g1_i1.p2  ORF type:complete len:165 (-),score=50.88 TRINITY_DN7268_c0_g1_i1:67-561(-)
MTSTPPSAKEDPTLSLHYSRVIPASPEVVFDAYTDAKKQEAWFVCLDVTPGIANIEVDLRVGGKQTSTWGPSKDTLFHEEQTFTIVERPNRLATTSTGTTPDGMTMTTNIDITFGEQHEEGKTATLMKVVQSGFPTPDIKGFFEVHVWPGATDRLVAYLNKTTK